MDQRGFVEISHFKNEQLYRAYLPMGVQWSEVHAALTELCDEVGAHVVAVEAQAQAQKDAAAAAQSAESAAPIDVEPVTE